MKGEKVKREKGNERRKLEREEKKEMKEGKSREKGMKRKRVKENKKKEMKE